MTPTRPLPSGRHSLPRSFVIESQRDRILDAFSVACVEKSYSELTIADIVSRARVSRTTFYELFSDKQGCFLAAYDAILTRFLSEFFATVEQKDLDWINGVRAGVGAIVYFMAAEPAFARMCMVEMRVVGPAAVERYNSAIRVITQYVEVGREDAARGNSLPPWIARMVVLGAAELIRDQLLANRAEDLPELAPDILYLVLTPYVGRTEAARLAAIPVEDPRPSVQQG